MAMKVDEAARRAAETWYPGTDTTERRKHRKQLAEIITAEYAKERQPDNTEIELPRYGLMMQREQDRAAWEELRRAARAIRDAVIATADPPFGVDSTFRRSNVTSDLIMDLVHAVNDLPGEVRVCTKP